MILARSSPEYLHSLLNKVHATVPCILNDRQTLPIIPKVDDPPSIDKVEMAILSFNDNIAAGPGINNNWSFRMVVVLYIGDCIILSLTAGPPNVSYDNGKMPTLFMHECKWLTEQNVATNVASTFFSMASNVLAKIMLTRILEHVVDLF